MNKTRYKTFAQFYPFYLTQHQHPVSRVLHVTGVIASLAALILILMRHWWLAVPLCVVPGYVLGWAGHFLCEKNRPATFRYPAFSFITMSFDILVGRQSLWRTAGMGRNEAQR